MRQNWTVQVVAMERDERGCNWSVHLGGDDADAATRTQALVVIDPWRRKFDLGSSAPGFDERAFAAARRR